MNYPSDEKNVLELKKRFEEYCEMTEINKQGYEEEECKYIWFAEDIINFTAYDDDLSLLVGKRLYDTCKAIINKTQSEYMEEHYEDYIICLNLIGKDNFNWGSSIRFCWFENNSKTQKIINAIKFIEKQNS